MNRDIEIIISGGATITLQPGSSIHGEVADILLECFTADELYDETAYITQIDSWALTSIKAPCRPSTPAPEASDEG